MEKKTPLYQEHVGLGARIVPFAGYSMPLEYSGIIDEHRAVRNAAGLFDLSHMGEIRIAGPRAVQAVDGLVTNDIHGLESFQVRYSPMCYPDGGIVDDLLVYRYPNHFMLVVNASNIQKDLAWITDHAGPDVEIRNDSDDVALVAVQGPDAQAVLQPLTDVDLSGLGYYHFAVGNVASKAATVSRTGYTGEDGFELYVAADDATGVWGSLLKDRAATQIKPVGLGARDTLRLEAGYMLYGNDIDESTSPLEAGLGWTVKFNEDDFIGRTALERQKAEGTTRRMVAVEVEGRRIPRPHCTLWSDTRCIGELTSGTFSPTLNRGIGLGYVASDHARPGTDIQIEIRDQRHPARIARKPAYKR
ncbi:MAG: glycine cleavage system aminomethyltransferase GcvT [Chloroflexota bacterium]